MERVLPQKWAKVKIVIILYFITITYSSAGVGFQVHSATTDGKLYKKRSFMPRVMVDQAVNTAVCLLSDG